MSVAYKSCPGIRVPGRGLGVRATSLQGCGRPVVGVVPAPSPFFRNTRKRGGNRWLNLKSKCHDNPRPRLERLPAHRQFWPHEISCGLSPTPIRALPFQGCFCRSPFGMLRRSAREELRAKPPFGSVFSSFVAGRLGEGKRSVRTFFAGNCAAIHAGESASLSQTPECPKPHPPVHRKRRRPYKHG